MNRSLSEKTLKESRMAYRDLDLLKAYELVLKSIEIDPSNFHAYYLLKNLTHTIAFSYPDHFDSERIKELIELSMEINREIPSVWDQLANVCKINHDFDGAEEAFFRAVFYNRNKGDLTNQYFHLFNLGYIYKNIGNMEIFKRIVFSIEWNVYIHRKIGRMAIPYEILQKRIVNIDTNRPPVQLVRKMKESPGRLYLVAVDNKVLNPAKIARFIKAFVNNRIEFRFFHIPDPQIAGMSAESNMGIYSHFPSCPDECPASLYTRGYQLIVCPILALKLRPILHRINPPWEVVEEKHGFCECK
ncbi:MAG: hypothetical protein K8T10_06920 [Candidatus Eremiobacteraeota bacterium]|nr:hypothetical protein [Candidatus Eremiobacteraeota bacterium]